MPRYRRVTWYITATSALNATTIQTAINAALAGKSTIRIPAPSAKTSTLNSGDYLFTLSAEADLFYTVCTAQLQGVSAISGLVEMHDCDHDAGENALLGGCSGRVFVKRGSGP